MAHRRWGRFEMRLKHINTLEHVSRDLYKNKDCSLNTFKHVYLKNKNSHKLNGYCKYRIDLLGSVIVVNLIQTVDVIKLYEIAA